MANTVKKIGRPAMVSPKLARTLVALVKKFGVTEANAMFGAQTGIKLSVQSVRNYVRKAKEKAEQKKNELVVA